MPCPWFNIARPMRLCSWSVCENPLVLDKKALLSKIGGLNKLPLQGSFVSLHDLIDRIILLFFGFPLSCSFARSSSSDPRLLVPRASAVLQFPFSCISPRGSSSSYYPRPEKSTIISTCDDFRQILLHHASYSKFKLFWLLRRAEREAQNNGDRQRSNERHHQFTGVDPSWGRRSVSGVRGYLFRSVFLEMYQSSHRRTKKKAGCYSSRRT